MSDRFFSFFFSQKHVVRIADETPFNAHIDPLLRELNFLKFGYINSSLLSKLTRGSNRFYISFCRSNIRKFSIIYQGPVYLNKLKIGFIKRVDKG